MKFEEKLKKVFTDYVFENYIMECPEIALKYYHSLRVARVCRDLASEVGLNERKAYAVGLLHDIARFRQFTDYATFQDLNSFDHGQRAVDMLFEEGLIKPFDIPKNWYPAVYFSIKNHNKKEIDFDEIEKQCGVCSSEIISYSKLIRDADKIDIIFQLCSMPKLTNGSGSGYNKKCLKELLDKQSVTIKSDRSVLDVVFAQMGLLFNIYYKESFDKIDLDKFFESRIKFTQNKLNENDMKILETTIGKVRFLLEG